MNVHRNVCTHCKYGTVIAMKALTFVLLFIFSSCSVLTSKGDWGKKAWYPVRWDKVKASFKKNLTSAHVWAPVVSAGILNVMAWDNKLQKWIARERIIYHERTNAKRFSDRLNKILKAQMDISILFTSSYNEEQDWKQYTINKLKGGALVKVASEVSLITHYNLVRGTDRERPDNHDELSFPSRHATKAGARRVLVTRNLKSTSIEPVYKTMINTLNTTMSAGVMWARIEANKHYPTDVLFGYAMASFISGTIYDALINLKTYETLTLVPQTGGAQITYTFSF